MVSQIKIALVLRELRKFIDLKSELDMAAAARGPDYCGSCYGGLPPESGCCQTCEEVRQAYLNRGWSFSNPDTIDQVCQLTRTYPLRT